MKPVTPCLALLAAGLLAGCGGRVPTPEAMNASYEAVLARTETVAMALPVGEPAAGRALDAAQAFFADMQADTVRSAAAAAYAPAAYLNDNIAVVEGADGIGAYFERTMSRVDALQVEFLDVAATGPEYFVRWRMTVRSGRLNGGAPMVSYGVTHFRFDEAGRILVHKDFWDAGTGLHEYLPGIGSFLRGVRAAAESG